jgi:F-type H+-transporting ATPase subunit delta
MPKQTNLQFAKALYEVTKDLPETKISEVIKEFFLVLQKNNKLNKINYIIDEFVKYSKKQAGIKTVVVETTYPADQDLLNEIKKVFGPDAEISQIINKNLLGGVKIKVDDTIFDGSLKTQLSKLKQSLLA